MVREANTRYRLTTGRQRSLPVSRYPLSFRDSLDPCAQLWLSVFVSDYRSLEVWQLGHATRLEIYRITGSYPSSELYGLVSQTRRAASSITSNIAEGAGRGSRREYGRFLSYAIGSANETEDHLLLARDLGYLDRDQWTAIGKDLQRVRSMLIRLRAYLLRPGHSPTKSRPDG